MARYVLSHRRAGKAKKTERLKSRTAMANVLPSFMAGVNVVLDNAPRDGSARRVVVFEAEPHEITPHIETLHPDVIVEPEILHYRHAHSHGVAPRLKRPKHRAKQKEKTKKLCVTVGNGKKPLPNAEITLLLCDCGTVGSEQGLTNKQGQACISYADSLDLAALGAIPAGGFWSMVEYGATSPATLVCPPLPKAKKRLGWWHHRLGIKHYHEKRGAGIRVAVIDTGIGPHPYLEHVHDSGAYVDHRWYPNKGVDVSNHGTYVSGIIGARPTSPHAYAGVAPGVDLYSARIYKPPGNVTMQGDIANAIDDLSGNDQVDLINLSLGAAEASIIVQDAIQDARDQGTLCICSAGNTSGPVSYPAAFPETVAVSALGVFGWGPVGSTTAYRVPAALDRFGCDQLYLANFSAFGEAVDCAAPGVGVISTVPARFGLTAPYLAMDGTSAASPAVCGILATILSNRDDYKSLPRDEKRAALARQILEQSCQSIGLQPQYEGLGMPRLS